MFICAWFSIQQFFVFFVNKIRSHSWLQWVYNILEHKAEVNRIICEDLHPDNGFVLLPDLKWNEKQMADLHVTAIVIKKEILSLRDLNRAHLPLLKNVLQKGKVSSLFYLCKQLLWTCCVVVYFYWSFFIFIVCFGNIFYSNHKKWHRGIGKVDGFLEFWLRVHFWWELKQQLKTCSSIPLVEL